MDDLPSTSSSAAVDLDKVILLFNGPNSSELHDRHIAAITKLCNTNPQGFAIRDLPKVQQVLELSIRLLQHGSTGFQEPLCLLIGMLSKPFIRRTATDEFKMLNNISSILTTLGSVFRAQLSEPLQVAALQTVTIFGNAHGNRPNALELVSGQRVDAEGAKRQYHTNQSLVCKSGIVADILQSLAACLLPGSGAPPSLVHQLVSTLLSLSYNSDNCSRMAQAGVLQCLAALLSRDPAGRSETTTPAVELLWNLLEFAPEARAALEGGPMPAIEALAAGCASSSSPAAAAAAAGSGDAAAEGGVGMAEMEDSTAAALGDVLGQLAIPGSRPASAVSDGGGGGGGGGGYVPMYAESSSASANGGGTYGGADGADGYDSQFGGGSEPSEMFSGGGGGGAAAAANGGASSRGGGSAGGPRPPMAPVLTPLAGALGALLRSLLQQGFSKADKELRNDILVVMNLMMESSDACRRAAASAGLFQPLLAAATCPEVGSRPDLVHHYALSTDALDYEMRVLVWGAMVAGCLLPEVLETAVSGGFLRVLLLYVGPSEGHPAVRRWNADQMAALRAAALSKLHQVSPLCPDEYERCGAPGMLLHFVATCPAAAHLEAALRHLHRLFVMVPELRDVYGSAGLIPLLLNIVQDLAGKPEPVRHFALLCLSVLCTLHAENQRRLRKAGGVSALAGALARLLRGGLDPLLPSPYAVALLDALWCGVVPDRKSTAKLLVEEGLDTLLSFLEQGNKSHRPVILSLLSDLLENPRTHPFFHEWRSDVNKQTAPHMILAIWKEEDALRGMSVDGMLANVQRPLAGLEKRTRWLPQETVVYGNLSPDKKQTLAMMTETVPGEAVLSKIYGIFKLIGFDKMPYLDAQDQAVLVVVEKYAKFRQGEVWRGMAEEFDASGMRPTAPDRARLASGIEMSESLALGVREAQGRLLGRAQEGARSAERTFFDGMRAQRKLEAEFKFQQLQDNRARTIGELRAAKGKKDAMLKSSMREFVFQDGMEGHDAAGSSRPGSAIPVQ